MASVLSSRTLTPDPTTTTSLLQALSRAGQQLPRYRLPAPAQTCAQELLAHDAWATDEDRERVFAVVVLVSAHVAESAGAPPDHAGEGAPTLPVVRHALTVDPERRRCTVHFPDLQPVQVTLELWHRLLQRAPHQLVEGVVVFDGEAEAEPGRLSLMVELACGVAPRRRGAWPVHSGQTWNAVPALTRAWFRAQLEGAAAASPAAVTELQASIAAYALARDVLVAVHNVEQYMPTLRAQCRVLGRQCLVVEVNGLHRVPWSFLERCVRLWQPACRDVVLSTDDVHGSSLAVTLDFSTTAAAPLRLVERVLPDGGGTDDHAPRAKRQRRPQSDSDASEDDASEDERHTRRRR